MKLDLKKLKVGEQVVVEGNKEKIAHHQIEDSAELVELFKKLRKKKKKTQEEIARYSNLSRIAVTEFENGKSDIRLSTLLKILKSCNLGLEIRE
ncbi:MAG: hypothetical protein A2X86_06100 [Bdellovibrionales bacterium GWA2_49_15]|nr:MAG: hypothetical protein A2X86_06100 [Bdellovibrionales bacterium GWA2_49_15]HAZ14634.1 hypothetical protein [Bdellovibrionales bacterium]